MPLGRGLESLIPNRKPDDADDAGDVFLRDNEPEVQTETAPPPRLDPFEESDDERFASIDEPSAPLPEPPLSTAPAVMAPPPSAPRSYQDHFAARRMDSIFWIEIDKVDPNPFQPRREFADEALRDLAESIREHGVIQPITVTKREVETPMGLDVRYELIAGERRWRASKLAGLSQIPALIRRGTPDDRVKLELALIENVQREDLNVMERALAFKKLVDEFKLVHREIAQKIGKSRELVANTLRLLALPEEIRTALSSATISEGHARAILMVGDDEARQFEVFHAVLGDRLTVRETENRARQVAGKTLTPRSKLARVQDPEMRALQSKLQERLGTKVELQRSGERGKIVVEFYSEEELRAILDKMMQSREEITRISEPFAVEEPLPPREFSV